MRVTETVVDYNRIAAHHQAIHARLVNWERWVRVRVPASAHIPVI